MFSARAPFGPRKSPKLICRPPSGSAIVHGLCVTFLLLSASAVADEMPIDQAWKVLPSYQYGQDLAVLLAMDREVIRSMKSPDSRATCAARLASILKDSATTKAARQYICFQLRQAGTAAEVPLLTELLQKNETSQMARYALQSIEGPESLAALRGALASFKGDQLVGVINSIAARQDVQSVPALQRMSQSKEPAVAAAAISALGTIGGKQATTFLRTSAEHGGKPVPRDLAAALLRCVAGLEKTNNQDLARSVYAMLSRAGEARAVRHAALEGQLRLMGSDASATIIAWFHDRDPLHQLVASGHLDALSDRQLDQLVSGIDQLSDAAKLTLISTLSARKRQGVLSLLKSMATSKQQGLRTAAIRQLAMVGDTSVIPLLIDTLAADEETSEAARQTLSRLPRGQVGPALLKTLQERPALRAAIIDVLTRLKYYEAIDPLIKLAARDDPAVHGPALDALRSIADPDQSDVPKLIALLIRVPEGKQRDEVEKTILIVCGKVPTGTDRAAPVLAALKKAGSARMQDYLPLLGRLGGKQALQLIDASLAGDQPEMRQAAILALCNWPDASVADRLLEIATDSKEASLRRRALRAYIRVISVPSKCPPAKTLAMLKKAMQQAQRVEDRQLILSRVPTVRTMDAVQWLAGYLDDPALAQTACQSLVELAHHRELRHPNMKQFGPILEKVGKISKDPAIVERAKRYRLGL